MSLRSRSHVKVSVVITRADHLCIHNYIRSLLNIIVLPILWSGRGLKLLPIGSILQYTAYVSGYIYIYIYIYIYVYIYEYKYTL